jgi:hypothetical protein
VVSFLTRLDLFYIAGVGVSFGLAIEGIKISLTLGNMNARAL